MADVRRTLAALQTLLADNTAGDISAQDVRDFLVSAYNPQVFAGGRLTLESGVPVSTTDQTAKTTIYYTPFKHDQIGLYDGTSWQTYTFTERSLALGTLTSGLPYDVYIYDNSGTLTLELTAWTNGTTRATALAMTNGVYLKTGVLTRRYLGTIYTTATTTTEDSAAKRFVYNVDNQARRHMTKTDSTANWSYTTGTIRQANNASANKLEVIFGLAQSMWANVFATLLLDNNTGGSPMVGVGVNSTTTHSSYISWPRQGASATLYLPVSASWAGQLSAGYNYLAWVERGLGGTCTFIGGSESGINSQIWN